MNVIIDYITSNYIWFLVAIIIILLAIVGYFAEKANFFQDKTIELDKEEDKKVKKDLNVGLGTLVGEVHTNEQANLNINNNQQVYSTNNNVGYVPEINNVQNNLPVNQDIDVSSYEQNENENQNDVSSNIGDQLINNSLIQVESLTTKEKLQKKKEIKKAELDEFNKEFDIILPKKDIISNDLLSDIDNLSLDRTQRIDLSAIPDLDDVDLPKIKEFSKLDDDIWKL